MSDSTNSMTGSTDTSKHVPETHEFKAEVQQLLEILIHSVYTSKDIFVRELVSNAADALEKVRFLKARGEEVEGSELDLDISLGCDAEKKALVITDTGIGMTEEEVRANLGTIAHSGAVTFLEQLKSAKAEDGDDISLIGRFGVGFYSTFMVARRVTVTTRSAESGAEPVMWSSDGLGTYRVEPAASDTPRGTRIEIALKDEEERFADANLVKATILKYSNFVAFPIKVDGEQINQTSALWREQPHQVDKEKYAEFYKFIAHDPEEPRQHLHLVVDVPLQFSALPYIPKTNTELLGFGQGDVNVQLYVKRVLIDSENKDLLPKYLRFARGVVESEDLPLNVSRETLQENPLIAKIRDTLTKKVLQTLTNLANKEDDDYNDFWRTFGRTLKEGYNDFGHREQLHELLRFNTSTHDDGQGLTSLAGYVDRMPEEQSAIYYLSGPSFEALNRDPRLELFRQKKIEVLYLHALADEFVLGSVGTYKEKKLVSAEQVSPDELKGVNASPDGSNEKKDDETTTKESNEEAQDIASLIECFKDMLGDRVKDVRKSERLVDSPACLVSDDEMSGHVDKMFRMLNKDTSLPQRTLELNAGHPLVQNLQAIFEKDRNDPFIELSCEQIFEAAMLLDGYLSDPHQLVARLHDTLHQAASLKAEKSGA